MTEIEAAEAEQRRLDVEIAAEEPSFEVAKMLAWVDGHDADDAVQAARERLDIAPLVYKRAGELAQRVRDTIKFIGATDDATSFVFQLRQQAVQALHQELRERCLIDISLPDTRRRFLEAWDSLWPSGM